jgi:hypothetical protein
MDRNLIVNSSIKDKIHTIRGLQVMLDGDLAKLYGVETRVLNQAVKRNTERFPENFMFQLTDNEVENLKSHFVIASWGGKRSLPFAFTEQGVSMLSGVLRSKTAIKVSIQLMNAFVAMRSFIAKNAEVFARLDVVERKQLMLQIQTEKNFEKVFNALQTEKPRQGILYNGQIFDAHVFVTGLVKSAKKSIVLIDNFVDESVLVLFSKRKEHVHMTIYTRHISEELLMDIKKYNAQYQVIELREFKDAHDRFLILDGQKVYHFGASLKDLGKKWFAFSVFEKEAAIMLSRLKESEGTVKKTSSMQTINRTA